MAVILAEDRFDLRMMFLCRFHIEPVRRQNFATITCNLFLPPFVGGLGRSRADSPPGLIFLRDVTCGGFRLSQRA